MPPKGKGGKGDTTKGSNSGGKSGGDAKEKKGGTSVKVCICIGD